MDLNLKIYFFNQWENSSKQFKYFLMQNHENKIEMYIFKLCAAIWQDFGHFRNRPPIYKTHTIECMWERRTSMFPVLDTNLWVTNVH
jgi:hypothetical protein